MINHIHASTRSSVRNSYQWQSSWETLLFAYRTRSTIDAKRLTKAFVIIILSDSFANFISVLIHLSNQLKFGSNAKNRDVFLSLSLSHVQHNFDVGEQLLLFCSLIDHLNFFPCTCKHSALLVFFTSLRCAYWIVILRASKVDTFFRDARLLFIVDNLPEDLVPRFYSRPIVYLHEKWSTKY